MFDATNIIVGLEIGTSKVCALVGETNAEGAVNIIGLGQQPSHGVRKGEIIEPARAEEAVRRAIVEAEHMADVEIGSVYLGVTGGHIRSFNNRGMHPVCSADREITSEDVEDVVKNAKAINLPADHSLLHTIRQDFLVDGQERIPDPVGMLGARLEVDMHVIHGNTNRLQNAARLVKGMQLEVEEIVFNGLAASLAVLTPEQKELGAVVIDLGGGTTDYVVYVHGHIRHSGVLAVGGDHITNDLVHGLRLSQADAEELKVKHGGALPAAPGDSPTVALCDGAGRPHKVLNREHFRTIMAVRVEEIFQLIAQDLEDAGLLGDLAAGVFLCGGGARIPEVARLCERVLSLPTFLARAGSLGGLKSALDQPEFATAIGLVKYGAFKQRKQARRMGSLAQSLRQTVGQFLRF